MNFINYNNSKINILCKICSKDFIAHPNSMLCSKECKLKSRSISANKSNAKVRNRLTITSSN